MKYYQNNLNSLLVLLNVMNKEGISSLVFSSSCTVYGEPDDLPVSELSPIKPAASPYGNTKQICEEILQDAVTSDQGLRAIALRYFNPIGAHTSGMIGELPLGTPENLIPYVTQTAIGLREKVTVFGDDYNTPDGTCVRDYIHVMDLANAHIKAFEYLDKQKDLSFYDMFNIGTGRGNSVKEIIDTFESVNKIRLNHVMGARREGDVEAVWGNVEKANRLLNWKAERSLSDSLKDSWQWEQNLKGDE